jgi:hypothetical protein
MQAQAAHLESKGGRKNEVPAVQKRQPRTIKQWLKAADSRTPFPDPFPRFVTPFCGREESQGLACQSLIGCFMIPIASYFRSNSPEKLLPTMRNSLSLSLLVAVSIPCYSQSSSKATSVEPPAGQYSVTHTVPSRLPAGFAFVHDTQKPPQNTREWRASHENFTPPESTSPYAQGSRTVTTQIWPAGSDSPLIFKRVLSNPYLPVDRIDLPNPNWVISPYFAQGFFDEISSFSCRPDGTLFVAGKVGVAADAPRGQHWARGIWRVEPDGKIVAHEVFPATGYMRGGRHSCDVRTCGLPAHAARQRALADGSDDWAEDRHGNVWGVRSNRKNNVAGEPKKTCAITRFNADGSDTVIRDHPNLCQEPRGSNGDFINPPNAIVYDPSRDEMVVSAGKVGANTDGSVALLRINQAGEIVELLRNWAKSEDRKGDYGYRPNPPGKERKNSNQVKERWWGIEDLHFNPQSQGVGFEVSLFNERAYPGRTYEIRDSFASLRRLSWSSPGQVAVEEIFGKAAIGKGRLFGDDQRLISDGTQSEVSSRIFGSSCFDAAGNRYFKSGISIRKVDSKGKLSTWVF